MDNSVSSSSDYIGPGEMSGVKFGEHHRSLSVNQYKNFFDSSKSKMLGKVGRSSMLVNTILETKATARKSARFSVRNESPQSKIETHSPKMVKVQSFDKMKTMVARRNTVMDGALSQKEQLTPMVRLKDVEVKRLSQVPTHDQGFLNYAKQAMGGAIIE